MKISQVYIINKENILESSIEIKDGKILNLETANNEKFIPLIWKFIFYNKLPEQFTIVSNKEGLFSFISNFNEKFIISNIDNMPIVNYDEILKHWEELKGDDYEIINPAFHRSLFNLNIRKIGSGFHFKFGKDKNEICYNINEFIKEYVSLREYEIDNILVSFKDTFNGQKITNDFYISNKKIKLLDYINEQIHIYNNGEVYNKIDGEFDYQVEFKMCDNFLSFKNKYFVDIIKFRIFNKKKLTISEYYQIIKQKLESNDYTSHNLESIKIDNQI